MHFFLFQPQQAVIIKHNQSFTPPTPRQGSNKLMQNCAAVFKRGNTIYFGILMQMSSATGVLVILCKKILLGEWWIVCVVFVMSSPCRWFGLTTGELRLKDPQLFQFCRAAETCEVQLQEMLVLQLAQTPAVQPPLTPHTPPWVSKKNPQTGWFEQFPHLQLNLILFVFCF